jgi:hypothetical protein
MEALALAQREKFLQIGQRPYPILLANPELPLLRVPSLVTPLAVQMKVPAR